MSEVQTTIPNADSASPDAALLNKPGYKTTEFYTALIVQAAGAAGIFSRTLSGDEAFVIMALTAAVYLLTRVFIKQLIAQHPGLAPVLARIGQAAQQLEPAIESSIRKGDQAP